MSKGKRLSKEEFIKLSIKVHGNTYDYSNIEYINTTTKITMYCKKHDIDFVQYPKLHLIGKTGCKKCAKIKRKQSVMDHYGVENPFQCSIIKEKRKQTLMNLYGVDNPLQLSEFKERKKQTTIKLYNVEHFKQIHISRKSLKLLNDCKYLINQHHNKKLPLFKIATLLGVSNGTISIYFKKHNIEIKTFFSSTGEKQLAEFIKSLGYKIETNKRNIIHPLELDIYVSTLNIALEYNGLYWRGKRGINYHKNKTDLCKKQGVHLIHVWEDEWHSTQEETKKDIIKIFNGNTLSPLTNQIEIDLAKDNPHTYMKLGYQEISQSVPKQYHENVWDCGSMILAKTDHF